jgi:hypothetical protein
MDDVLSPRFVSGPPLQFPFFLKYSRKGSAKLRIPRAGGSMKPFLVSYRYHPFLQSILRVHYLTPFVTSYYRLAMTPKLGIQIWQIQRIHFKEWKSWCLASGTSRLQVTSILSTDRLMVPGLGILARQWTSSKKTWALLFEALYPLSAKKLKTKMVLKCPGLGYSSGTHLHIGEIHLSQSQVPWNLFLLLWETSGGYFKKLGTVQSMDTVVYLIKRFSHSKIKGIGNIDAEGW